LIRFRFTTSAGLTAEKKPCPAFLYPSAQKIQVKKAKVSRFDWDGIPSFVKMPAMLYP
jgi:hypothetical protein